MAMPFRYHYHARQVAILKSVCRECRVLCVDELFWLLQ